MIWMKWIMTSSLPYTHDFELESNTKVELRLTCHEKEIMQVMRSTFGKDVEVELFNENE